MPHELSGGQQQRVGLARAVVTRPKVLLMDEPLSNLDAQLRIDLRRELRTIQQKLGITTIYVTHDQEEALEMSDFVCVMHKGVIQHSDTPWAIYHEPANQFVASFVGSNNFLQVTMEDGVPSICGLRLDPSDSMLVSLRDKEAVASIRPEHIKLCLAGDSAHTQDSHIRIPVSLQYRSFAGRELRLSALAPDGATIQFVTEPRPEYLELGENAQVHLRIRKNRISFFRADSGGARL
jgi:iron(III) transport system ATP-binding protein